MRLPLLLGILLGVAICLLPGWKCADSRSAPSPQVEAPSERPSTLGKWDEDIKKAQADNLNASTELGHLEAQKREAEARAHRSEDEARQWHELSSQKDVQIRKEQDRLKQVYLYWAAGIFLLLAIAAAVIAVWQPLVRKIAGGFSIACLAGAALCVFISWLVPYLIWVGGGLGLIGLIAVFIWWKRDAKSLRQVVEAVGAAKDKVPEFKDAYRGIFREVIDTDAEAHIDQVRARVAGTLAKAKTKLTDASHKLMTKV